MPGNTSPIFSKVAHVEWVNAITAANTAKDGTGTVETVFTADASNGSYLQKLIVRPRGANVASVLRVFLNNGASNTTADNNVLIAEVSLPATALSEVAALSGNELPLNIPVPPGYRVNVTLGTAVAGGYAVTGFGGDY
ncbi:MAG: hypothetical protein U1A24_12195 [Cypionkella sp.]|uniref:hypothetical protein n=1 Tax=Cypionkella sp. TaxID=2811411 RepID=UPI002AB80B0C|nr:hypothetical protein [Cypionkella sp.]MDZ4311299.1 hypothetical protein [Cypionkella sp.]MDZ4391351.1 hypothetical protein [Cypionkella sp.]